MNFALFGALHKFFFSTISDKPIFNSSSTTYTVIEGESLIIDSSAEGNPSEITYKWTGPNKDKLPSEDVAVRGSRFVVINDGKKLNVSNAKREDKGKYKVKATNGEGDTVRKFHLDVHYKPK